MDILVLNKQFETVRVIDDYISLVWTERYASPGEFSLEVHAKDLAKYQLIPGYYLWRKDTPVMMLIQYIRLNTDAADGNTVIAKGMSLECLLWRRVIQEHLMFDETVVKSAVTSVINRNIRHPSDNVRAAQLDIEDFPEKAEKDVFSGEFNGETVGDVIEEICDTLGYGFYVRLDISTGRVRFKLYEGVDRSWQQDKNPWVVYSPKLDTLLSSEFVMDTSEGATSFVICGEAESQTINPTSEVVLDWPQVWVTTDDGISGWDRVEAFIDGSGISRWAGDYILGTFDPKDPDDVTHGWKKLSEGTYKRLLLYKTEKVRKETKENTLKFEAVGDHNVQWRLNEDMFLGDIVEVANEYGVGARCRITETTLSHDRNGLKFYPTFKALEDTIGAGGITWPSPLGSTTRSTMIECMTQRNSKTCSRVF